MSAGKESGRTSKRGEKKILPWGDILIGFSSSVQPKKGFFKNAVWGEGIHCMKLIDVYEHNDHSDTIGRQRLEWPAEAVWEAD